jgi:glycosyltransferase involved in cell wall biosynthesis
MHGDGTKLDHMTHDPPARLLDLTRLTSRAGQTLTGVDRVEHAYLKRLLAEPIPLFGLIKTGLGYILLDQSGVSEFASRVDGTTPWGALDVLSRLSPKRDETRKKAEADARRHALARCRPSRLTKTLAKHLPANTRYINVGLSNLTERVLWAVKHGANCQITVMIHDTIPLDFPQYQGTGSTDRFRKMLKRVASKADLILCNSAHTQSDVLRHCSAWDLTPETAVAHLGVDVPKPLVLPLPEGVKTPYMMAVGTIEPRKNHQFLLDLWAEMTDPPQLLICGKRGWNNAHVFQQLDALGRESRVLELPDLTDDALFSLMKNASALLFPTFAEGYGLPPIEAAALDVPIICNDLPVFKEVLGHIPVYASVSEGYLWTDNIKKLAQEARTGQSSQTKGKFEPPTWDAHFNLVLRLT